MIVYTKRELSAASKGGRSVVRRDVVTTRAYRIEVALRQTRAGIPTVHVTTEDGRLVTHFPFERLAPYLRRLKSQDGIVSILRLSRDETLLRYTPSPHFGLQQAT